MLRNHDIWPKVSIFNNERYFYFMAPFYGWGSTASRLELLRGGSLLFTTKFPEFPGIHGHDNGRSFTKHYSHCQVQNYT